MSLKIPKPNKKGTPPQLESKGAPPSLEETPISNLEKPTKTNLAQMPLAIHPDLKKELKMTSAELGIPIVQILMEAYQLWKKHHNRV